MKHLLLGVLLACVSADAQAKCSTQQEMSAFSEAIGEAKHYLTQAHMCAGVMNAGDVIAARNITEAVLRASGYDTDDVAIKADELDRTVKADVDRAPQLRAAVKSGKASLEDVEGACRTQLYERMRASRLALANYRKALCPINPASPSASPGALPTPRP